MPAPAPTARALLLLAAAAAAQDPSVDLPHRRVQPPVADVADAVSLALAHLEAGRHWEAWRGFREVARLAPDRPLGALGQALAARAWPRRAATLLWDAVVRREGGSAAERRIVDAYARCFDVAARPTPADPRHDRPPDADRRADLVRALHAAAGDDTGGLAARLAAYEAAHAAGRIAAVPDADDAQAVMAAHHEHLRRYAAMPWEVPHYRRDLLAALADPAATQAATLLARLPRHPRWPYDGDVAAAAAAASRDDHAPAWQPHPAPGFDLVRGLGGRGRFADYAGRPTVVVFFLGFGCVHCVAQLAEIDPKAPAFRRAGIELVSIGTDDPDQVKAAHQAALENGADPLHFDVLCDPGGDVFRAWRAWDEFDGEALHGTFLVDARGRILWQDIGRQPFLDTAFLLRECPRLLAAWR